MTTQRRAIYLVGLAMTMIVAGACSMSKSDTGAVPTAMAEPGGGNDWTTYHGTYQSWHYSPLTQINTDNVKRLRVAWVHHPGRSTRGLQSMPLVSNGVLYYTGSYSRVWAIDAATGTPLWSYFPKLNDDLVAAQTHSPYTRGIALGHGKVFVGTVDGRLIAIDQKTGQPAWDTKLINSEKLTVGFTGAPLLVKDKVIIGAQGGEWPGRGPIFGVDAASGR
jgi:alcohol dehydrogenase (cytochrome c)